MYADAIVSERLALARLELGFPPEYHSVAEVEEFQQRLEQKYLDHYMAAKALAQGTEDPGKAFQIAITRALASGTAAILNRDEVRFMQNERALCMCDAAYFLTRYFWIKTPRAVQRFTFLPGQRAYFNVIAELEALHAAIELIISKARQHGISTETEGLSLHRACFSHGVNVVIASADRQKTGKMAQMTFLGYDRLPWWMRPLSTRRVESDQGMLVFGASESGISFQHGNQTSGIARGDTVKVYHLSECASYSNAEEQIEASLFRCVHPYPDVFGVLESTAEGDTGWWPDTYWYSKKNFATGKSRLCALFLPWFLGTDKYPTETWIRTHPIPAGWRPDVETRSMIARAKLYIRSSPVLEKVLGANWKMPDAQSWFWEVNYLEHRAKGKERLWFQEMPTDDRESFQGSYDNVFGREVIAEVFTQRVTKYAVYGIIGQSIEARHEPDEEEVDYDSPRVPVAYKSRRGETYRWEMVPLNWTEPWKDLEGIKDDESHMGKFFVYLVPEPGYDYAIGIDTSNGIGSDSTVIAVSRRGRNPQEPDEQAAEFRSDKVSHVEAYAWAMCIAAYYSRYMEESTSYREPYVAVEQIMAVGDTVQLQMSNMGYGRFHKFTRYDSDPKYMRKSQSRKRGWFTTGWSRPMLTDGFVTFVQNGWYKVNSPYTNYEMDHWEVHLTSTGKEKKEHSEECTDDGIFANAMAAFCPNDRKTMADRSVKRLVDPGARNLPTLDIGVQRGATFSTGDNNWQQAIRQGRWL